MADVHSMEDALRWLQTHQQETEDTLIIPVDELEKMEVESYN